MTAPSTALTPVTERESTFVDFLHRLEFGRFVDDCDDNLTNLLRALAKALEIGAKPKGTLTLKITMELDENAVLIVSPDLAVTKPRHPRKNTVLFADANGNIVGAAPQQLTMFPQGVVAEPAVVVAETAQPVVMPAADADGVVVAPSTGSEPRIFAIS